MNLRFMILLEMVDMVEEGRLSVPARPPAPSSQFLQTEREQAQRAMRGPVDALKTKNHSSTSI